MFRFWRDETGNTAIIFSLALIPIVGLIGAGVDYTRKAEATAKMQNAIDATALALSQLPTSTSLSTLQTKAQQYFDANFSATNSDVQNLVLTVTPGNSTVTVGVTATMPVRMMVVSSLTDMPIAIASTVKWGGYKLRVALALDTTGSMASDNKLATLKTATKNLLAMLQAAAVNDGDVLVSIIPFSEKVNVGSSNRSASWLDWTEYGTCTGKQRYYPYQTVNTGDVTKVRCLANTGTYTNLTWTANSTSNWQGCVTDRGKYDTPYPTAAGSGYDQIVDLPNSNSYSKWPAAQDSYCPGKMVGLTSDWTTLNATVDALTANGATDQPLGLVWAWQSLVGGGPLTAPAMDPNAKYKQAIILLSDGLNTRDRWYGNGSSTSTSVDKRMYDSSNNGAGTCTNIKNAFADTDFTLYTIQVNTDGDPTSTLLQNCASPSTQFQMLTSASQIITAFNNIGTQLTNLRISQ